MSKKTKLSLQEKFFLSVQQLGPFGPHPLIAVAVSGGADSMALTLLLNDWVKKYGGRLMAVTVDHGLRKEAADEAKQVTRWLNKYSIEHHILTYKGDKPASNIQSEARNIRYELMTEWCKIHNIIFLFVAHHLEDQAETFLLRLERGSGVDGLASMAEISPKDGILLLRPLLNISKKELIDYLQSLKQEWINDPSNEKISYKRNRLRKLLEIGNTDKEIIIRRIAETATSMGRVRISLETKTAEAIVHCVNINSAGFCYLELAPFCKNDEEIGLRILASILCCISGNPYRPRFNELQALYNEIIKNGLKEGAKTLYGCLIYKLPEPDDRIVICREESAIQGNIPFIGKIMWDGRFFIENKNNRLLYCGKLTKVELKKIFTQNKTIRESAKKGISIIKHGNKISKIPKAVLTTLPVIKEISENGVEKILSIPHIGYYNKTVNENDVSCIFSPAKSLADQLFGCYAHK